MPIDVDKALGAELGGSGESSWNQDDVILYHLGLGAAHDDQLDPSQLAYTYENGLKVLPSYGVIPPFGALTGFMAVDGIDINPMMILHGEQDITLHGPIPTEASVRTSGRITEIWDKGKGALVVIEAETVSDKGTKLFTNRFSTFIRGEGGFGGESGPKPGNAAPDREPDQVLERTTWPGQALLYRLSGDKNPLHADPQLAAMVGYDKPILHGLCTFGVVCKAVVDELLDGDVTKVARYQVRFAGHVFPGETLVINTWNEGEQILIGATTRERGEPVLTNAAVTVG